jgi:MinD-like ATPase involved in chromosome partitioning or flagellar assembly
VLSASGRTLDPQDVLDVLWLARLLPGGGPLPLQRALRAAEEAPRQAAGDARVATAAGDASPAMGAEAAASEGGSAGPDAESLPDLTAPGLYAATRPEPAPRREAEHALTPTARQADRPAMPVRVPEAKALTDELLVGRALRPLKRRQPSTRVMELDEEATAAAVAETGLTDVVLRPVQERWLHVVLVVDDGLSMLLWHRLAADLITALQRLGAFRSIRILGLDTRGVGDPVLRAQPFVPDSVELPPTSPADPSGQTLVVVLSDGMGQAWRRPPRTDRNRRATGDRPHRATSGGILRDPGGYRGFRGWRRGEQEPPLGMQDLLLYWAALGPVALVHALPPALWDATGIQADRWQATTRRPGGANTAWDISDPVLPPGLGDFEGVPVPVLQPTAATLGDWARLLSSPGTTVELPLLAKPRQYAPIAAPGERGSVQHFRDAASPEAYRLAAHLAAVAPVSVPVMRLVQSAVPWQARTEHLAEVFLGGLVLPASAPVPGPVPAKHRVFDFSEDAKSVLLDAVPSAELLRTSRRIGRIIEQLAGRAPDFPAWLAHPDGADTLPPAYRSFTALERRLMSRFGVAPSRTQHGIQGGRSQSAQRARWAPLADADPRILGPYRLEGRRDGGRTVVYRGTGPDGTPVAVRTVRPELPASTVRLLTTEAEALRRMNGNYAPQLVAAGLDDSPPWIAMRLLDTERGGQWESPPLLSELVATAGYDVLTSLTLCWHLAGALSICLLKGLVPARLTADSVVVLRRSVVLMGLSDSVVDGEFEGAGPMPTPEESVWELGELMRQISSRPRAALPGLPEGMHLWQGDTWEPLRSLVLRCLDPEPAARPSAAEIADRLARYVAVAQAMRSIAGDSAAARHGTSTAARPRLVLRSGADKDADRAAPGRKALALGLRHRTESAANLRRVATPLTRSLRIAVVGAHTHCGRATTTFMLGSLLAAVRSEPVLALDGAPGLGDLHDYLDATARGGPRELLGLPADATYEQMREKTTRTPSGLEVAAHRSMHSAGSPAHVDEYTRVLAMTAQHYSVVLTDWAWHRLDGPAADAVLDHADRLVVCCTRAAYSLESAETILTGVHDRGRAQLADSALVVVSHIGGGPLPERFSGIEQRVTLASAGMVSLPFDDHLASDNPKRLARLRPRTTEAYLRLAAALISGAPVER